MKHSTDIRNWAEAGWTLLALMLLVLLTYGRQALEWFMMKAYEFFIQQMRI
jgi:hypothetical protein